MMLPSFRGASFPIHRLGPLRTPINSHCAITRRFLKISTSSLNELDLSPTVSSSSSTADARFEVVGSPCPLLSVSLSASQYLHTRRGTLVGLAGKVENTISTLSLLEPFTRAILRIPFLYQKISSTTPVNSLISTNSPNSSIIAIRLDGTTDWVLAAKSLLAWTGQTLSFKPTVNYRLQIAHWGNTEVTGRGLLALAGQGSISELTLEEGESYIAHPGHVLAYSVGSFSPQPYRFKSSAFRLQVPNVLSILPDTRFFRVMRESETWRTIRKISFTIRTWARRTIWGDRLFLRFEGPATLLLQSRASKITDALRSRDVNEYSDVEPGALDPLQRKTAEKGSGDPKDKLQTPAEKSPQMHTATVGSDGKVKIQPV